MGLTEIRETMSSEKATSFDTSSSTEWGDLLAYKIPSLERVNLSVNHKTDTCERPDLPYNLLIINVIIIYKNLAIS